MKTKLGLSVTGILLATMCSPGQPVITNQPQTQAVAPGATATFRVGASGAQPLAYQWQGNPGTGFANLADSTNAVLTLTNPQPWDAWDYRVVVSNVSGASTSTPVHLYVLLPGLLTNRVIIDNFDDNRLTGWSSVLGGRLTETNQQFTVHGYWPGVITYDIMSTVSAGSHGWNWSVLNGQTLEFRVDLVSMNQGATAAILELANSSIGACPLFKGRDFIHMCKWTASAGHAHLVQEPALLPNTNVTFVLALTRVGPNLILTGRILDKANNQAVLYEHSFVDTPSVDRTLTEAEVYAASGMRLMTGSDCGLPMTSGDLVLLDVWQYNYDGHQPPAEATFDNLEVRTYKVPLVRYVNSASTNATPPYTNWAGAARVIQDAVDAAAPGDVVVVTNGIYATGGRAVGTNQLVNRVAVDKPLALRSVNGPDVTIIEGYQVAGTTNGDGASRCVYLADGATLSGFRLTNGATLSSGRWDDQAGGGVWCESTDGFVTHCVIAGNSAYDDGGGAEGGTLDDCTVIANSTGEYGGGAGGGELHNCTLAGNSARLGGGAAGAKLYGCTLKDNSAEVGGGASGSMLYNCALTGNSASDTGGGAAGGALYNCTVTGNSAGYRGGGVGPWWFDISLHNCIVHFNSAPVGANYFVGSGEINYCCTTPLPIAGAGNINSDPQLASASHLSASSPCRGAGNAAYAIGTDIDGDAWCNPPSIGCDEYHVGAVIGPLSVSLVLDYTNVAVGFPIGLTALIGGQTTASRWDFGDGVVVSNRPWATHAWATAGDYLVDLRAYNETYPAGVSATLTVHVVEEVHYVAAGNVQPLAPYTSWATAARDIQDAVDAAIVPGSTVLVTNGLYATGGRAVGTDVLVNRVAVNKPLMLRGVNGPQFTVIQGYQVPGTTNDDGAIRCVFLASGASLSGFTLTNGATRVDSAGDGRERGGGGVWCESPAAVVSNCVLVGNSANNGGGGADGGTLYNCMLIGNSGDFYNGRSGGGAAYSTLNNCTLAGNRCNSGGGAADSTLNNCTLTGNSWDAVDSCALYNCTLTGNSGAGAYGSMLYNCTVAGNAGGGAWRAWNDPWNPSELYNCLVYFNTAQNGSNYDTNSTLNYCCTIPMPTNGFGNITNAPLFVDYAGGNLRLQSNSPCINAGNNAYVTTATDLDGNPRIVSGTVDIGAYEYQGAGSVISYAWLQQYGLPTDGSADFSDPDHDGMDNWQEWICGTDPTMASSALRMLSAAPSYTNAGVTVTWQSVAGVSYCLERARNLTVRFNPLATNIVGQIGTTTYADTNATGPGPFFYRVGVNP